MTVWTFTSRIGAGFYEPRRLGGDAGTHGQMALRRVHAVDADHVAAAGRRVEHAQLAELTSLVGLVQPLADQRRTTTGRAVRTPTGERSDTLAQQDRGDVGHATFFGSRRPS